MFFFLIDFMMCGLEGFSVLGGHLSPLVGFVKKTDTPASTYTLKPLDSELIGLGRGPKICIFNKPPPVKLLAVIGPSIGTAPNLPCIIDNAIIVNSLGLANEDYFNIPFPQLDYEVHEERDKVNGFCVANPAYYVC